MVMDATQSQPPSPQSVGREFVRQYYTLLNKAPNHLHRFYNNNSSFIHGENTLVVGQKNIHSRIQQLNFHDCHAKISQVDAQATLGNGVVVQVTGELSNDGQPMRRFTQTFVLAAQSPKKYYVHNDIFRYQDVYSEEENDIEPRSESEEEHKQQGTTQPGQVMAGVPPTIKEQQHSQVTIEQQQVPSQILDDGSGTANVIAQSQPLFYSISTDGGRPITVLPAPPGVGPVPLGTNFANIASNVSSQQHQTVQANGVASHDELMVHMPQRKPFQQSTLNNPGQSSVITQGVAPVTIASDAISAQSSTGAMANASTVLSQNSTAPIGNYQQPPSLLQPHSLQQQLQPQPQGIPNVVSQQNVLYQQQQQQLPIMAGNRRISELEDAAGTNASPSEELQNNNTVSGVGRATSSSVSSVSSDPTQTSLNENFKTVKEQNQQKKYDTMKQQQQPQNEPKTYANLFKSTPSPNSFVNAAQQQQQTQQNSNKNSFQANSTIASTTYSQSTNVNASISIYGARNSSNESGCCLRQDNTQYCPPPLPQRPSSKTFSRDFDQRRTSNAQFGDNQQLFLGNIPHHASEEELKTLFARFGTVLDLRILSKPPGKLPPGIRNPLNYGFITYEDADSVQNCLAHCPLYFPENSPDGQKLNVEEKKPRSRPNDLPSRQTMSGCGNGLSSNINSNQRSINNSGLPTRSLSNSGAGGGSSMLRGNGTSNNMSRGGSSGPRMGTSFNRNDRSSNSGTGGSQIRGGNNNVQTTSNNYSVRR